MHESKISLLDKLRKSIEALTDIFLTEKKVHLHFSRVSNFILKSYFHLLEFTLAWSAKKKGFIFKRNFGLEMIK